MAREASRIGVPLARLQLRQVRASGCDLDARKVAQQRLEQSARGAEQAGQESDIDTDRYHGLEYTIVAFSSMLRQLTRVTARARAVLGVARLEPYDTSTAEGRSLERYRRIALSAVVSVIGRGVAAA